MTIDDEIKKYKEIIIVSEYKKRKMLEVISKYFIEFSNSKDNKEYLLSNLLQMLILIENIDQCIEEVKLKLELTYTRKRFRTKFFTDLDRYSNNDSFKTSETQYKIELYKLMSIKDMDTKEYEEQLSLVKKYKKLVIDKNNIII